MSHFDNIPNRKNTSCTKYDALQSYFGVDNIQPLWVADMDFEIPTFISKAIQDRAQHNIFGYGKQNQEIYKAIQHWMKSQHQWEIDTKTITLTNGVVPAYSAAIEAFSNEGDEVIVQTPVYFPLFHCVTDNNRTLVTNPLKHENGYYTMDLEHLESIITPKTKILTLCSPHNPVGRVWTKEELTALAKICIKHNIIIISDEIHADLVFKKFTPLASLSEAISNITLTLNSAGKTFNIAGLNASYAITTNETMKRTFDTIVKKRCINSINVFGLIAMQVAYENGNQWLEELKNYIEGNIDFTIDYLQNRTNISIFKPEATYLLWLNFEKTGFTHKEIKKKLLRDAKVALNDGISFGSNGNTHFRLNASTSRNLLKIGLDKIINSIK